MDGLDLGLDEVLPLEVVAYVSWSSLSCTAGFRMEPTCPSSSWAEFRYLTKYLASLTSMGVLCPSLNIIRQLGFESTTNGVSQLYVIFWPVLNEELAPQMPWVLCFVWNWKLVLIQSA